MAPFAGTSIHYTQCTCITASSTCTMSQSLKGALQLRVLHLHLLEQRALVQQAVDHHLSSQQHHQHRMGSRDHFLSNIDMGIWDIFGFKRVIFPVGASSSQMIIFIFPLFLSIVPDRPRSASRVDSIFDIIFVILAVLVPPIFVNVFVYLVDILITMITAINYRIILLEMVHNNRTSSSINIRHTIHNTQPYTSSS